MPKQKALFLDRDGVINLDIGYLYKIDDVAFVEGIFELCREAHQQGYTLIVITNQAGIGRGYYTENDFHLLMDWMKERFAKEGCPLSGIYFCPHHPKHGQGEYLKDCDCRKPEPGMLLQAIAEHDIDAGQSLMIGDKDSDMQAAEAVGVKGVLVEKDKRVILSTVFS